MQVNANLIAIRNVQISQQVSADNVANVATDGFVANRAVVLGERIGISPEARAAAANNSTTDLGRDFVAMSVDKATLNANVEAIRTQDRMQEALLNIRR